MTQMSEAKEDFDVEMQATAGNSKLKSVKSQETNASKDSQLSNRGRYFKALKKNFYIPNRCKMVTLGLIYVFCYFVQMNAIIYDIIKIKVPAHMEKFPANCSELSIEKNNSISLCSSILFT